MSSLRPVRVFRVTTALVATPHLAAGPSTHCIVSLARRSRSFSGQATFPARRRYKYLPVAAFVTGTIFYLSATQTSAAASSSSSSSSSTTASPGNMDLVTSPRASSGLTTAPFPTLVRSYFVYTACSIPYLIDAAPSLLRALTHSYIPGLKGLTEFIVRHTFFAQFVPGESVRECVPCMEEMRGRNIGSVLNYSAEADEDDHSGGKEELERKRLQEVYAALKEAGEFEGRLPVAGRGSTAFALKITGLIDPDILARASTTLLRLRAVSYSNAPSSPRGDPQVAYPGTPQSADAQVVSRPGKSEGHLLSLKGAVPQMGVLDSDEGLREGDLEKLKDLWGKLKELSAYAKKNGVKLMIDAEHSWYQPSLDAYTILLSQEFNHSRDGPLIYGTFQSYLNRQPEYLSSAIKHAEENDYVLGIKLVRGAYFVQERKKWKDENRPGPDPIWVDKASTDKAYNSSVEVILSQLARQLKSSRPDKALSVVFGTHNQESCDLIVEGLKKEGLAEVSTLENGVKLRKEVQGKVYVAQLYGMKDDLTDKMAAAFEPASIPFALKYIAYGGLSEVMPFLGRRAIENKSVMSGEGGAASERKRLSGEIWRRIFG